MAIGLMASLALSFDTLHTEFTVQFTLQAY